MNKKEVQSKVNVPFSWENKQGVSNYKVKPTNLDYDIQFTPTKPLPLSKNTKDLDCDGLKIPPPPCFYERPVPRLRNSSSRRGLKKQDEDDPFYIAYKECTKTSSSIGMKKKKNKNYMSSAFS
ncbi:hypothetical protein HAX54_019666, partial [Datura stramonium]|nr:hypothetical protein [Datura stramonium]